MKVNPLLGVALLLLVTGCKSFTRSSLSYASLTHEEREHVVYGLNLMLVRNGFAPDNASSSPLRGRWYINSSSTLWKGQAEFRVGADANASDMTIVVWRYGSGANANKALIR